MRHSAYHNLPKGTHLHDVLELLIHVSEGELACRGVRRVRGQTLFFRYGCWQAMLLTVLQLVNQLFIVIQFQVVNSVDQTLDVSHSCQ